MASSRVKATYRVSKKGVSSSRKARQETQNIRTHFAEALFCRGHNNLPLHGVIADELGRESNASSARLDLEVRDDGYRRNTNLVLNVEGQPLHVFMVETHLTRSKVQISINLRAVQSIRVAQFLWKLASDLNPYSQA